MNIQTNFSPTSEQILEVEQWLMKETPMFSYHNWQTIYRAANDGRMMVVSINNKIIGFGTWEINNKIAAVENIEINSKFRLKGLGNKLVLSLLNYFIDKKIFVAELNCYSSVEPFWRKLNFIEMPTFENQFGETKKFYKVLVNHLPSTEEEITGETLELWYYPPHQTRDRLPNHKWNLQFIPNTRKLIEPIIAPCHYDWRICWKLDGKILIDKKLRYFNEGKFDFRKFIIVEGMPQIN